MNEHRQVYYSGRVQGVGFRYSVKQIASGYDVVGWVRNLDDGRVEAQVSGDPAELDAFLAAVAGSHLREHIKEAAVSGLAELAGGSRGFEIRS